MHLYCECFIIVRNLVWVSTGTCSMCRRLISSPFRTSSQRRKSNCPTVQFIVVVCWMGSSREGAYWYIRTRNDTRVNFTTAWSTAKASTTTSKGNSTLGIGWRTRNMGRVYTFMRMAKSTAGISKTTWSMVLEGSKRMMGATIQVSSSRTTRTGMDNIMMPLKTKPISWPMKTASKPPSGKWWKTATLRKYHCFPSSWEIPPKRVKKPTMSAGKFSQRITFKFSTRRKNTPPTKTSHPNASRSSRLWGT